MKINPSQLVSFDFQVFGIVQGVHFRYYTLKNAEKFKLVGWVQNTNQNTVIGQCQGQFENASNLAYWLSEKGSPHSKITKLELTNCRLIDKLEFDEFFVKKTYEDFKGTNESESSTSKELEAELREYGKKKFES